MIPTRPFGSLFETVRLNLAIRRRHAETVATCLARRIPKGPPTSGRPRVLYLAKPIFNDDIAALRRFGRRFEYLPLPSTDVRRIYYAFVSRQYHHNHTSYYEDDNLAEREAYFRFVRRVMAILRDRHQVAAVLSANYNYCWQQEVARAWMDLDVPFIVLHKEGINPAGNDRELAERYTNSRFVAHAVLAYNRGMAAALEALAIENLTADRIVVVGVPRLDGYVRCPSPRGMDVAFFGFAMDVPPERRASADAIARRTREFHQLPLRFAEQHPEVGVVLKFKNSAGHHAMRDAMVAEYGRRLPANVSIAMGGNAESIIRRARAVASGNSTTLVEGLLAGRSIITPRFDDVVPGGLEDCFSSAPERVTRAATLDEFDRGVFAPPPPAGAVPDLLEPVMFRVDGRATDRVEEAIRARVDCRVAAAVQT